MVFTHIYLLPVATFVLIPATFIITYIISVLLRHVEPDFPYISDTGTYSPESCIFGQLLNIGAVLIISNIAVRYAHVRECYKQEATSEKILKLNRISFWLGTMSGCGISLVANFQETNVFTIHSIGAFMCFGLGTIYLWIQAIMSYRMQPIINSLAVAHIRVMLSVICTLAFVISSVTGPLSVTQFHGKDKTKWYPNDGGFGLHVASTVAEWTLAIAFNFFILTFVKEFQRIHIGLPQLYVFNEEEDELVVSIGADDSPQGGRYFSSDQYDSEIQNAIDQPILRPTVVQTRPFRELLA